MKTLFLYLVALFSFHSIQAQLSSELDHYFRSQFPSNDPGAAVLISRNDSVIFSQGYGLADIKTKEPITSQTLFNLGSISKTFVANAILILRDEGKLSLDDNLAKYFPTFKKKTIAAKIKIKHLLSHTSGLPDNRKIKADSVFYLTAKDRENWYPVTQNEKLAFEPGERFEYSNPAYNGLALIVENISGMKWQQFVSDRIFIPSGMTSSTITDGPHPEQGVAHGYIKVDGQWLEKDYGEEPTFAAAGNGGVWSSVTELEKYEEAIVHARFLKATTIRESRTIFQSVNWSDQLPPTIGWSWFIGKTAGGLTTIGHKGSQGGFLCNYVTIPARGIHFYILCNAPRDIEAITNEVMKRLLN
jgi:CubicO group peptidase (beta-lactamase class C family)